MAITNVNNLEGTTYTLDDFDESKNYQRILFKPGFAVQARELTQLQTALQAQIDKLGQYTFADGDRVLAGKLSVNVAYDYVKLDGPVSGLSDFVGTIITGGSTGVTAEVIHTVAGDSNVQVLTPTPSESNVSETLVDTLYIKYTNSGTDSITKVFATGENIVSSAGKTASVAPNTIPNITGIGSAASISEGVYFIAGNFVYVESETIILDHYINTPNYIVGLRVAETLVSSSDDTSLQDNANNTTNAAAPGGDRYKIDTTLIKQNLPALDESVPGVSDATYIAPVNEYIHLVSIRNGVVIKKDEAPIDTELSDRLERRTKEESGDYVLAPFILDIKEHLNDGVSNNGYLLVGDGGDADKLAIGVDPSVAYIDGRRIEKTASEQLIVDKPRLATDEFLAGDSSITVGYGNYFKLNASAMVGVPDIKDFTTINLKDGGVNGTTVGTCRARDFRFNGTDFELYVFDLVMNAGQDIGTVDAVSDGTFEATLAVAGKRFDAGRTNLVFPLPATAVSSVEDGNNRLDMTMRAYCVGTISGSATDSSGKKLSITPPSGTTLADLNNIIIGDGTNDTQRINVAAGSTLTSIYSADHVNANSTVGLNQYAGGTITVIANIAGTNMSRRTKTLERKRTGGSGGASGVQFTFSTDSTITAGESYSLGVPDVFRLLSVKDQNNNQANDVTDRFILDTGQRDGFYDVSRLILKGGETLKPSHTYYVEFDYYEHGSGDYFSVDSYPDYADIPSYNNISLRDAIDFRPTKNNNGVGFQQGPQTGMPPAFAVGSVPLSHWMPRLDKIFLTKEGEFKVIKGQASRYPVEPENIENALHLYTLRLNPYVFGVHDVIVTPIDNRRYTMRDIGALDQRVKNLEYYTSLSLLERSASEAQILDSNGNQRFKNGFIVDGFFGHNVGDSGNPDYGVSIDKSNGILRPQFDERNINLIKKPGNNGTTTIHNGGVVTLPYTTVTEINQPLSSYAEFVNPYNVISWAGTMVISPESDEWKETDQRPDIIIDDNSQYEQMLALADSDGILGTVWNEWETNWTGVEYLTTSTERITGISQAEGVRLTGVANNTGKKLAKVDKKTQAITNTGTKDSDGIQKYLTGQVDIQSKEVGNFVVETNFIPFMRSRKVYFKAELLKPDTKFYAFFNGVNVTSYCKEESYTEFHDRSEVTTYNGSTSHDNATGGSGGGVLITDASGKVEGSFIIPNTTSLSFKTGTREFKLTDDGTNNDDESTSKVSQNFHAQGLLEIYQRTIINTKVPRIATREVNQSESIRDQAGSRVVHELVEYYDPIAETFVIKTEGGVFTTGIDLFFNKIDPNIPVQVSLREVQNGYPTQRIIPGADAIVYPSYIASQASTTVADFANANASIATPINWDYPVHLKDGTEYAVVIISMSDKYKVYVAETSEFDLTDTTKRITKQPYDGVFFTSANASTWTAEQSKDLKFKLKRASFSSSATLNLINDKVPDKKLGLNPLLFEDNSGSNGAARIKVFHKNHGMYGTGHTVKISGLPGSSLNGVQVSAIQGSAVHTVIDPELDSYYIEIPSETITTSDRGTRAGGTEVYASENQMYDLLRINSASIEFPKAEIEYSMEGRTARSMDAHAGLDNQSVSSIGRVLANKNIEFNVPHLIASEQNEAIDQGTSNRIKTFDLTCSFTSELENLTPIIDLNRTSLFTIQNRINDASANSTEYTTRGTYVPETVGTNTSNTAKYITKQVELQTEGTVLDVYINANKPRHSNIDVYYKTTSDSDADFDALGWTLLTPDETIPTNDNEVYSEVHYENSALQPFSKFQIKIVLRSQSSTNIPTVKDFRAIATT